MEEKDLIRKLKLKDEESFKFLVEKYKNKVYNTSLSIIQNSEDAEDLSQEVFIQIFKSINSFKQKSSLSTWIYRITLSKSFEYIKDIKFIISNYTSNDITRFVPDKNCTEINE